MNDATTVDLLALLAEVDAELATPEGRARVAREDAEYAARMAPRVARPCRRCHGRGYVEFRHVQGGVCFECNNINPMGY
jgi:hypothetical protein